MSCPHYPLVTVVVLSYNRPHFIAEAIESVVGQSYQNLEIIVIDNPSPQSEQIACAVSSYPEVRLIRNPTNVGFAAGMNVGIAHASGEYIYLTEDDMILHRECIARFVEYAQNTPDEVIATGIMLNHESGTIRCAGGHVHLNSIPALTIVGKDETDPDQFQEPYEVSFIPGAMLFARRDTLERVGGFREDFFMYLEDTELCFRAIKHGVRILVVPKARARHFEPPESDSPEIVRFHQQKNVFALYLLHAKLHVLPEFFVRYVLLNLVRSALRDRAQCRLLLRALRAVMPRTRELMRQRNVLAYHPEMAS